jgi:hypothetical protein
MADTSAPQTLILASKVNGTPVFNSTGDRIGHIEDVAIGKVDGRVGYAILSFGGFLGIGEKFHPLPWSFLTYDTDRNAYVVALTKEELKNAPAFSRDELADTGDTDERYRGPVFAYYGPFGATPYWIAEYPNEAERSGGNVEGGDRQRAARVGVKGEGEIVGTALDGL